jgi:hypothetical protein
MPPPSQPAQTPLPPSSITPYWQYIWISPALSLQAPTVPLWSSRPLPAPAPAVRNTLWDQFFAPTLSVGTTIAFHPRGGRGFELSFAGNVAPFLTANFFQPAPLLNPANPSSGSPYTGTQVGGNAQGALVFFNRNDTSLAVNASVSIAHLFAGTSAGDVNQFAPGLGFGFQRGIGDHAQFGLGLGVALPYAWGPGNPIPTLGFAATLTAGFTFSPFLFP